MQQRTRRNRVILGLVALGLLAGAALTASPADAVDAVGPYYAEPAWDQKLPVDTRFVVLTNWGSHAVLDKETGLVWEKSPNPTPHTWADARSQCASRTTGNRKGWKLPLLNELASLVDNLVRFPGPTLPLGHPFVDIRPVLYWSASTDAENPTDAWFVNFSDGFVSHITKAPPELQVWCVRGGGPLSEY